MHRTDEANRLRDLATGTQKALTRFERGGEA